MILLASAADWVSAVSAAVAAGVTALLAPLVLVQLRDIKRQTKQSALANVSQSYAQISEGMGSLRGMLFAEPEWNRYFFEGVDPRQAPTPHQSSAESYRLDSVCDQIVDLADTVVEQRNTVPGAEMDWSTWDAYFRFIYQNSPLLRRYLQENIAFYPDYVFAVFGYVLVRDEDTGDLQSQWKVDEWRPDLAEAGVQERLDRARAECLGERAVSHAARGYPWFRTWVITRLDEDVEERDPRLVAHTRPSPSDPETASVAFAWCEPESGARPDDARIEREAERVLRDWVLTVLHASTRLRRADVVFHGRGEHRPRPAERVVWRRRPRRQKPDRERYLAPRVPAD